MKQLISLKNICRSYRNGDQELQVLKNINLEVHEGEFVAIMGPSGSGKSTLMNTIGMLDTPTSGQYFLDGKEVAGLGEKQLAKVRNQEIGFVFQQFFLLSKLNAFQNVELPLIYAGVHPAKRKELAEQYLEKVELHSRMHHLPSELSGGQKQRVSLAGVLIDESPILLFDEPLANLDPKSGQDIIDLIDQIHEEQGTTTIIIEHRLEDVLYRPVDRIILINQGQVLFNGQPDELLRTTLLAENGIREPLYLTTLRQLGQDISKLPYLDNVRKLPLENLSVDIPTPNFEKGAEAETILELGHLNFAYREGQPILKDLSLTIPKGQRLAIVGKNGAGKSTLAKAICGFIQTEGTYFSKGEDIKGDSVKERAERVGYVLQNPNQMISTNMIFDEVALGMRLRGVSEEEIKERVYQALKTCGLYEFRKWPISALSYGQKKRVTIASILVLGPEVLVLDEPTAGQDQRNYTEIMDFLDELHQKGHTIVMITHDMQLMLDYSDRAIVVTDGQILADLTPAELLTQPEILRQAHLKETSIFALANRLGVDPLALTQFYMNQKGAGHE